MGPQGFFAQGFHSAINWDQVARLQQLWAVETARLSTGPFAWQNSPSKRGAADTGLPLASGGE